ncbi:MAG: potassium-transporting ATPase subunit KdpA, partial [Acidiferrobacteraceae bacterium]
MTADAFWQVVTIVLIAAALSVPFGRYLARVFMGEHTFLDPLLDPVDRLLYG